MFTTLTGGTFKLLGNFRLSSSSLSILSYYNNNRYYSSFINFQTFKSIMNNNNNRTTSSFSTSSAHSSTRMSQSRNGPKPADRVVLDLIKSKGNQAIWVNNIQIETRLSRAIVNKCIKTLLDLKLIKEVKHVQYSKKKHYIAAEFMPTDDVTGGSWYVDGKLDAAFINQLKEICLKILKKLTVATSAGVYDFIKNKGLINNDQCTSGHISEILTCMVLDNVIIEVKSTGLKEYHSIPIGNVCYRAAHDQGPKIGALASIPCGMCPHFEKCTPDGLISPSTCDYFTKWLEF